MTEMAIVMVMTMMMMIVLAERIGEGLLYYAARPVPPFPLIDYHHHSTAVIILEEEIMLVFSFRFLRCNVLMIICSGGALAIKILHDRGSVFSSQKLKGGNVVIVITSSDKCVVTALSCGDLELFYDIL